MFGYLNLGDPAAIGDNEAQAATNCRFDRGYLEYATWATNPGDKRIIPYSGSDNYYINEAYYPEYGKILRKAAEVPGLPTPAGTGTLANIAHTSNPYPPGLYTYALTYQDDNTGEEGPPITNGIGINTNEISYFSALPVYSEAGKTLSRNLYRLPLGGSEFLFVANIPMATTTYNDTVTDTNLGGALDTEGYKRFTHDGPGPHYYFGARLIVEYAGKIFAAVGKQVCYSLSDNKAFTKNDLFFEFDSLVTDLLVFNETLLIFTQTGVYILYGNEDEEFVIKKITTDFGGAFGSARSVGSAFFASSKKTTVTVSGASFDTVLLDGVISLNGNIYEPVSQNIKALFPLNPIGYINGAGNYNFANEASIADLRFWVLKYSKLSKTTFSSAAEFYAESTVAKLLIYDTITGGFLQANPAVSTYTYRTKEFGNPANVDQFRLGFIESQGAVTLNIYGDGTLLTTLSFNNATRTHDRFRVAPRRCHRFSFEFVGGATGKVFSYGRINDGDSA